MNTPKRNNGNGKSPSKKQGVPKKPPARKRAPAKKAPAKKAPAKKRAPRSSKKKPARKRAANGTKALELERLERQTEALRLFSQGNTYREIAEAVGCSVTTVHRDIAELCTLERGKLDSLRAQIIGQNLAILGEAIPVAVRRFHDGTDPACRALSFLLTHQVKITQADLFGETDPADSADQTDEARLREIGRQLPAALLQVQKTLRAARGL